MRFPPSGMGPHAVWIAGASVATAALLLAGAAVASAGDGSSPPTGAASTGASAASTSDAGRGSAGRHGLPGEQSWALGASSYLFGTNDSINYGSPNVDTLASVKSSLDLGKLTLMRTWAYATDSDAAIRIRLATIEASGMRCMMMLGSPGHLSWLEHVVALAGQSCDIYEFGNEPDNSVNATSIAKTVVEWDAAIPALRALNPRAVFGGPAVQYPTSVDGSQGSYPSDIAYFLGQTAKSGVRADFISYHHYPCYGYTSQSKCLADTPGTITSGYKDVLGWEKDYYRGTVPTGITEYNFDPGSGTLSNWGNDGRFVFKWTEDMLTTLIDDKVSFANQFTTLNHSSYGLLDMYSDAAPYGPKPQYYAMVDIGEKYGSGSTVKIPPGG